MAAQKSPVRRVLAGDIGGTKTRLGLFDVEDRRPRLRTEQTFASSAYENLASIIEEFLDSRSRDVDAACFGIAGPVINNRSRPTNLPWTVSESNISNRLGGARAKLINDLAATALAVPVLRGNEIRTIQPGRSVAGGNRALIAPGTGLGQAILLDDHGRSLAVASEGGHSGFAPSNEEEVSLWRYLQRRYGHVSTERVLSGPGLVNIYEFLRDSGRYKEPRWLTGRMAEEDKAQMVTEAANSRKTPIAVAALRMMTAILGASAGNLALTAMSTGGVYIGGGIAPKILPHIDTKQFLNAFREKGRFTGFLEKIPVKVILNDRAALLGAANCARQAIG
jgi:glucokinase